MTESLALPGSILAVDKTKLEKSRTTGEAVLAKLQARTCTTAEEAQTLTDFMNRAHVLVQDLESERETMVRPLIDSKTEIDGLYKVARSPWEQVKALCKSKVAAFHTAVRSQQEEARKRAIAAAAVGDTQAVAEAITAAPVSSKQDGASVSFEWVVAEADVLEMAKHPMGQQYLIADTKSLARVCAAAKTQEHPPVVPGVKFERRARVGVK